MHINTKEDTQMAICKQCGAQIDDNAVVCPSCGAQQGGAGNPNAGFTPPPIPTGNDYTMQFDYNDIQQNKVLALFAYLEILFLIPLLAAPNSPYARFHTNQGLVLFLASIASGVVVGILTFILIWIPVAGVIIAGLISGAVSLCLFVFMILGIVNAVTGKAKELPLIGKIRILK